VERHLTLPGPEAPAPEVRVAQGVTTTLRFDAPIERASVEVQGGKERFLLVDVGERSLLLEPSLEPRPGERLSVKLRYRGSAPEPATFWLVSHPTYVDGEVKVERRPRTPEAMEARLARQEEELTDLRARCEANGPTALALAGLLDVEGVKARRLEGFDKDAQDGLRVSTGTGYRATRWALASLRVRNLSGQKPWEPGQAHLTRADGTRLKARLRLDKARLAPGEEGVVAVETDAPSWPVEETLRLELLDASGTQRLLIPEVSF
jgi:uncharacterized protein (TIGR02268 family)